MLKSFFRDSLIYTLSGILSRGAPLLLLPVYTRNLSTSDFGYWEYILALGGVLAILLPLEITQGMARYIADTTVPEEKFRYGSTTVVFTLLCYLALAFLALVFNVQLSEFLFDSPSHGNLVKLCTVLFGLNAIVYAFQNILRWSLQAIENTKMSLIIAVFTVALTFYFLYFQNTGIWGAILAPVIANVLAIIYILYFKYVRIHFRLDWAKLKEMLSFSLPLVPSSLAVIASLYMDRILIKNLLSLEDLAYYSVAYRISTIIILIMVGFQGALTPLIYSNYKKPEVRNDISRLFKMFTAMALIMLVSISIFVEEGIIIFLSSKYLGAATIIPFLIYATLLWQMYIFAPGLSLAKKTGIMASINIASAIVNLALNWIFIQYFGLTGAAVATLISAGLSFTLYMYFSQKFFYVPHQWIPLIFAVLISVICIVISIQLPLNNWMLYPFKLFLIGISTYSFIKLKLLDLTVITKTFTKNSKDKICVE
jgi:O-antigen/teichoic acid export membrane protein